MKPLDVECYPNYFLIVIGDEKIELRGEDESFGTVQAKKIERVLQTPTYGFNSISYDLIMLSYAVKNYASVSELKALSDWIINNNKRYWETLREKSIDIPANWKHVDLIEPAPGVFVSLKKYGCRLHSRTIQDLPYPPDEALSFKQMDEVRKYCENDIQLTVDLYAAIKDRLDLRQTLSRKYGTDMMSKSDAQCAEAIFKSVLGRVKYGDKDVSTVKYKAPAWLKFNSKELSALLSRVQRESFEIRNGKLILPKWLAPVTIGRMQYKFGIGGLHSTEKQQAIIPDQNELLIDADVASYYPSIIRKLGLYPTQLGERFCSVYSKLIDERIAAKHSGNKVLADGFKIALNGSYGKFGSPYSFLYSPDLLLTVTLTGQLALLMLIEAYDSSGLTVVSANTDGVVCLMDSDLYDIYNEINADWEFETGFELEQTRYTALYSRDVNNYLAIKASGYKGKGVFTDTGLMKDPAASIVHTAVTLRLTDGVPVSDTIMDCTDIRPFIIARNCTGGGEWRGKPVGKTIRWVWSTIGEPVLSLKNGNKVAGSDGAYVMGTLPERTPRWLDRDKYIEKANELLRSVGA